MVDPENAFDHRILGAIYLLLGDCTQALTLLEKALKLEPDHSGAKLNVAKSLLFLGKVEEGKKVAKELVGCKEVDISNDAEALLLAYK